MRRVLFVAAALALLGTLAAVGPSSGQDKKKPLEAKGWGSLTGRVVLVGDMPEVVSLVSTMEKHADKACCLAGKDLEKTDTKWIVDPKTKGVANVLVYLKAPLGTYFPIHDEDKKRTGTIVVDQPHCQFMPRMQGHYPAYFDGNANVPTGEQMLIKNSAVVTHNIRGTGDPLKGNPGFNYTLPPGTQKAVTLNPQRLPVMLNCDIHPWMKGWVGVYDHPYFAVTKEDGTFTIPRVPAGAELAIMGWHEEIGYVLTKDGQKATFQAGDNKLPDISLKR